MYKKGRSIMENDFKGRKCAGCRYCVHANRKKMKCYPNSKNCKKEYDLAEEDFHKEARCDFFRHR